MATDKQLVPTLSELIDACGDGFIMLMKLGNEFEAHGNGNDNLNRKGIGKTPEEAVANLYLKLKKVS